jgi:hypothetical protein
VGCWRRLVVVNGIERGADRGGGEWGGAAAELLHDCGLVALGAGDAKVVMGGASGLMAL